MLNKKIFFFYEIMNSYLHVKFKLRLVKIIERTAININHKN